MTPACPACTAPDLVQVSKFELQCSYCRSTFSGKPLICPACGWINTIDADLCQDMGISPDPMHPRCDQAIKKVGNALKKTGKIGALFVSDPSDISYYMDIGFNMIVCGLDAMILNDAAESILKKYRSAVSS